MSYEAISSSPTRITVHPEPRQETQSEITRPRKPFQIATPGDMDGSSWGGDGFGVDDFIDLINPLQHIPVVGHIYREITGDEISQEASVIGAGLFGGPIGVAAAGVNAVIAQETGGDIGENAMALVRGKSTNHFETQRVASAKQEENFSIHYPPQTPAELLPSQLPTPVPEMIQQFHQSAASSPAIPNLPALDLNAVSVPHSLGKHDDSAKAEPTKHDMILDLFSEKVQDAHDQYQKSQMIAHVMGVRQKLTA